MIGDIKRIIVIESLKNERLTGQELYDDVIARNIELRKSDIVSSFHRVENRKGFQEILNYCNANSPYMEGGLLLHLEMHGNDGRTGLVLSDGSLLTWQVLVDLFRTININTANNLYVSLATCNGRYLYTAVNPALKSPYSCYISASEEVNINDILEQYTVLFERLIEKGNLVSAYLDMEKNGTKFYYKDSKTSFEDAFLETAMKARQDPDLKKSILEETRAELDKEGLPMPPDEYYEKTISLVLANLYNKHKQAFEFPDQR